MKINVKKLNDFFNLNILEGSITGELELQRFLGIHTAIRLEGKEMGVILGEVHIDLLEDVKEKFSMIIISDTKKVSEESREKLLSFGVPVLYAPFSKRELIATLDSFVIRETKVPERIHATMMSIFGKGVLIMGKSGIGKSELALELINRNHLFIGDDAIDVISFSGVPFAKATKNLRDFIEVRGIGIINVKGIYGIKSMLKEQEVDLIIELVNLEDVKDSIERLGSNYQNKTIAGVEIPKIQIPLSPGRAVAPVIESAVAAFKQRKHDNYIAIDDVSKRMMED